MDEKSRGGGGKGEKIGGGREREGEEREGRRIWTRECIA